MTYMFLLVAFFMFLYLSSSMLIYCFLLFMSLSILIQEFTSSKTLQK